MLVVSTVPKGPGVHAEEYRTLANRVSDLVDTFVVQSGRVSRHLQDNMPDDTAVYNGTYRLYEPNLDWVHNLSRIPLHRRSGNNTINLKKLVRLCEKALRTGDYRQPANDTVQSDTWVVKGVIGDRAVIQNAAKQPSSIAPGKVLPGVSAESLFQVGMQLQGAACQGDVAVLTKPRSALAALAGVDVGDVVLARVVSCEADMLIAEVYPGFQVSTEVPSQVAARYDFFDGAVVKLSILAIGAKDDEWQATLALPSDECVEAPTILPEGPAWLRQSQVATAAEVEASPPDQDDDTTQDLLDREQELETERREEGRGWGEYDGETYVQQDPADQSDQTWVEACSEEKSEDPTRWLNPVQDGSDQEILQQAFGMVESLIERHQIARDEAEAESLELRQALREVQGERDALLCDTREHASARLAHQQRSADALSQVAQFKEDAAKLRARNDSQSELLNAERSKSQKLRRKIKALEKAQTQSETPLYLTKHLYCDEIDQFNAEVRYHWMVSTAPADKEVHVLPDEWFFHDDFLPSAADTIQASRQQIVRTVVDVLIARRLDNIDIRPSLKGVGGTPRTRSRDGAVWQRINIQAGSASACRMHACRDDRGVWTFGNVGVHDCFIPPSG